MKHRHPVLRTLYIALVIGIGISIVRLVPGAIREKLEPQQLPDYIVDREIYDRSAMRQWMRDALLAREPSVTRCFSGSASDTEALGEEIRQNFQELCDSSAQIGHDAESISSSYYAFSGYLAVTLTFTYTDGPYYEELPSMPDLGAAVDYSISELSAGNTELEFRCGNDWDEASLRALTLTVWYNTAVLPVLPSSYSYYFYYSSEGEQAVCHISYDFAWSEEFRAESLAQLSAALDEAEAAIRAYSSVGAFDICMDIADYLLYMTTYDEETREANLSASMTDIQSRRITAYGPLVDGYAICSGYAMAFKALCDRFGIPCAVISGSYEGAGHGWNVVSAYGERYYIDCTFADTSGERAWLWMDESTYLSHDYAPAERLLLPAL